MTSEIKTLQKLKAAHPNKPIWYYLVREMRYVCFYDYPCGEIEVFQHPLRVLPKDWKKMDEEFATGRRKLEPGAVFVDEDGEPFGPDEKYILPELRPTLVLIKNQVSQLLKLESGFLGALTLLNTKLKGGKDFLQKFDELIRKAQKLGTSRDLMREYRAACRVRLVMTLQELDQNRHLLLH